MTFTIKHPENDGGMNPRIKRLREESVSTPATLTIERALIETAFYKENYGKYSIPVLRAKNFYEICAKKTLYIGPDELIVGERGPKPKAVPTFPELTCHSVEDLHVLDTRELQTYHISQEDIDTYAREVIPYWKGKTQRERIFNHVSKEWEEAYHAGVFTEFMEQRAAGHTAMDGRMYREGLLDMKARIEKNIAALDYINDPEATDKEQELDAMRISCDAAILLAERHAALAEEMAAKCTDPVRKAELEKIASVCHWVPAHAPRDLWEAIQMYWFVHLGTVTELNGWDSMNPGHIDQHLYPFYKKGVEEGTLTYDKAKELLSCLWIKFNNQPAPPKVGITARESGTYNDFTNINIGGVDKYGARTAAGPVDPHRGEHPRRVPRRGHQGHPPGPRLSVRVQSRYVCERAGPPGQEPGGRPRGRLLRLHRGGRLRQGSLSADGLPEHAEATRAVSRRSRSCTTPGTGRWSTS